MRLNNSKVTLYESFMHNLNEGSNYELYDEVLWIGAGNEIGATGKIVEFPEEGRMTIKWDDGDVNTYSLNHPNIKKSSEYDNSFNECNVIDEAIEQKYEKSNPDYNSRLKDVRQYTGSYNYLFGGKVATELDGDPIKVNYFYYERPYDKTSYNLVTNVITPLGVYGDYIQDAIDKEFETLKYTKLSNKEIKDKINQIVSSLNESNTKTLKEQDEEPEDITWVIEDYEYTPDISLVGDFRNSGDSSYFTTVKSADEAARFNYHSDHWGTADGYQEDAVELLENLEPYIGKTVSIDMDGETEVFRLVGVAIDKQYNSISHMKILVEEV